MARFATAGDIINRAAAENGITPVTDPYASSDDTFKQLVQLLNSAGQEMLALHEWNKLNRTYEIITGTTVANPVGTGKYDLPEDFGYFIDQTGWDQTERLPLGGPMTSQDYAYLVNTNLANSTVFVTFRQNEGQFWVLPDPPLSGQTINFQYISRNWVQPAGTTDPDLRTDTAAAFDSIVLFEPILIIKFLGLRFMEAKGFDTTAKVGQFLTMFNAWTGKDVASPVLRMARSRVFPYLGYRNIPETGYGS
jgi:hypothetical protein